MTKRRDTGEHLEECRCGILASISEDLGSPAKFSEEKGEYTFTWLSDTGIPNSFVVRFCPFCGGQLPSSRRTSPFVAIPPAETVSLNELLEVVVSLEDALKVLGKPDADEANSFGIHTPVPTGQLSRTTYPRVLTYRKLSKFADVRIIEDPASGVKVIYEGRPREKTSP